MSVIQVGLVDTTGKIDSELMQAAAAALNLQVTRDLPQFWPVQATVRYLPHATRLPAGVWPVQLVKKLPPGEGGFHLNKHNQPYAKVIASPKVPIGRSTPATRFSRCWWTPTETGFKRR